MKDITILLCVFCAASLTARGNGWSFEPPPKQSSPTNEIEETTFTPIRSGGTPSLLELQKTSLAQVLDDRLLYSVGRMNPLQTVQNLSMETPGERMDELQTRDGKSATLRGLRLSMREFGVRTLRIGGAIGDLLSGRKVGTVRPSIFDVREGIPGWNPVRAPSSAFFWEGDPLRENVYVAFGWRKADWLDNPLWEARTRLTAEDWQFPRAELIGTAYLARHIAVESGVQVRSEVDGRGNFFGRGDDQRFVVFAGVTAENRYGNLFFGATSPLAGEEKLLPRASVAFWHRW